MKSSRHRSGPSGLRVARRGMQLATELELPLVSVIDTSGAALSKEAEQGGMAGEIARCLAELVGLPCRPCASCSGRAPAAARWP